MVAWEGNQLSLGKGCRYPELISLVGNNYQEFAAVRKLLMLVIPGESLDPEQHLPPRPCGRLVPELKGPFASYFGAHEILLLVLLLI
jgi:hypothetical protein